MTGVFRELEIDWGGETYRVTPSNRLLRRIEGGGVSFPEIIDSVASGKPKVAQVCFVVSEFLKAAGADVSEDDIYDGAMTALAQGDEKAFINLAAVVVEAIAPKGLDVKKPQDRKPRSKTKKSRKG